MELQNRTLGQWLEHWAEVTPDKEYIVYSDRDLRFTWKAFNERVDDMAKGMLAIGIKHGTHVGIWATNVPDWLTFLFAGAKIGAVLVTVNTNYKQNELEFLVKDSDIQTLCITDGVFDGSYVDMVYTMLPELKESQRGYVKSERFPKLKNVVYIGQEKYRGMYNTAELMLLGQNVADEVLTEAKKKVNIYDVVNMQYTSGTTGFPKGVMLTHHNISNNGYFTGEGMGFTADDKLCCCVPLFHCFGVVLASMNVLTHGCTQVMVESFDPLVVLASVHKERCTALYGVPDHVHCRNESSDVQHVRSEFASYGNHGRIALSYRTDAGCDREDAHYLYHQRLRIHRKFSRHDAFRPFGFVRETLPDSRQGISVHGSSCARSRNAQTVSC
jgi:fatty-acyl-CoA synthase